MDILKCMKCTTGHNADLPCPTRTIVDYTRRYEKYPRSYEHTMLHHLSERPRTEQLPRRTASTIRRRHRDQNEEPTPSRTRRAMSVDREASNRDMDDFDRFCALAGFVRQNTEEENKLNDEIEATLRLENNKENISAIGNNAGIVNNKQKMEMNEVKLDSPRRSSRSEDAHAKMRRRTSRKSKGRNKKHSLTITPSANEIAPNSQTCDNRLPKSLPSSPRSMENKTPIFTYQTLLVQDKNDLSIDTEPSKLQLQFYGKHNRQLSLQRSPERRRSSEVGKLQVISPGGISPAQPATSPTSASHPKSSPRRGSRLWTHLRSILEKHHYIPVNPHHQPGLLDPRTAASGVSPERRSVSAPHSRSTSLKRPRRARTMYDPRTHQRTVRSSSAYVGGHGDPSPRLRRQRTASLPTGDSLDFPRPTTLQLGEDLDPDEWQRIRRFVTTPKGFVSYGDLLCSRSTSSVRSLASSTGSCTGAGLGDSDVDDRLARTPSPKLLTPSVTHRVVVVGAHGSGKSTMLHQFATADGTGDVESSQEIIKTVPVHLDNEVVSVELTEMAPAQDILDRKDVDAYAIVYAVDNKPSFQYAVDLLYELRQKDTTDASTILVANKADLVRTRVISEQEGKSVAKSYNCKYTEISSLMGMQTDTLLAGMVRQIHLHKHAAEERHQHASNQRSMDASCTIPPAIATALASCVRASETGRTGLIFNRLFRRGSMLSSRSCDNLLVL